MISKELAKAVLSGEYKKLTYSDGEVLACHINICELAHKCKEWARTNNYNLDSGVHGMNKELWFCFAEYSLPDNINETCKYEHTEPEAIFAACEWILEQGD